MVFVNRYINITRFKDNDGCLNLVQCCKVSTITGKWQRVVPMSSVNCVDFTNVFIETCLGVSKAILVNLDVTNMDLQLLLHNISV